MMTTKTLQNRIDTLKAEIVKAERELAIEMAKSPPIRLADLLHKMTCNGNHTDGCGWEYEKESDYTRSGSTRHQYYKWATKILTDEDVDDVVRIISKFADTRY